MPMSVNEAARKSPVLMPEGVIGGGGYKLVRDPGADLLRYPGAPGHRPMHVYCDSAGPYIDLVILDPRFVFEAHEECDQVMIEEHGIRPYALVVAEYGGARTLFAAPLRSNIRFDTPSKSYLALPNRQSTRPGNHHGLDITKMVPVCGEVLRMFSRPAGPLQAQRDLVGRLEELAEKAQAYLFEREAHGPSNTYETNIDAIARWVLPRFAKRAA